MTSTMKRAPQGPLEPHHKALLIGSAEALDAVRQGRHDHPHAVLGLHAAERDGAPGHVLRVLHPEAQAVDVLVGDDRYALRDLGGGVFALWLENGTLEAASDYVLELAFADGSTWQRRDPYGFAPTVGDLDLYYLAEGTHQQLWRCLGARSLTLDGVAGFAFAVWAPNARRVSVVGDFCHWDGRLFPMRRLGTSGVFEIFMPGFRSGEIYKYEILTASGARILKADPMASFAEEAPNTASRAFESQFTWGDDAWREAAAQQDIRRRPMSIYEVHLGSWLRGKAPEEDGAEAGAKGSTEGLQKTPTVRDPASPNDAVLSYRELAPRLVKHVKALGFNYLELLPVAEYPFTGSWGYQITGYFAPTSRHGNPDDFRFFVDYCHRHGIGVILDWVPAHFVKDAHGLGRFDGSALYEHEDPRRGEHPDWGTYIFNYGRYEVRSFLLSNALFWLQEMHIDGLRVDAVASMLYLDYSREDGQWIPNQYGGRENIEAIDLLRRVNRAVQAECPGCFTVAEESTAWPGITHDPDRGGLGFTFKWNMGWMHDTLGYFGVDPLFRAGCHDQLTFAMVYEYSECFINPLSHDEVVHGKGSLFGKMSGDSWRKLANLRTLYAYQFTRPGKNLLFMGSELGPVREWNETTSLDWYLLGDPSRKGLMTFVGELGALYAEQRALWESDPDEEGFAWVACQDREASVVAYERRSGRLESPGLSAPGKEGEAVDFSDARPRFAHRLLVVLNLTPVPRKDYRLGAFEAGRYRLLLSSDEERFGGSGFEVASEVETEDVAADGCRQSMVLTLPPLAALVLQPVDAASATKGRAGTSSSAKKTVKKKAEGAVSKKTTSKKKTSKKTTSKDS